MRQLAERTVPVGKDIPDGIVYMDLFFFYAETRAAIRQRRHDHIQSRRHLRDIGTLPFFRRLIV